MALVYNNPSRNYLMEIQSGMLEACRANHYNLVLAPVGSGKQRTTADIKGLFENFEPDGMVLIPPLTDDSVVSSYLEEHDVPCACIAPRNPQMRIGVMMEETAAALDLMAGLVSLGHRRIGHTPYLPCPDHGAPANFGNGPAGYPGTAGQDPHSGRRAHGSRRTYAVVPRIHQATKATVKRTCAQTRELGCDRITPYVEVPNRSPDGQEAGWLPA